MPETRTTAIVHNLTGATLATVSCYYGPGEVVIKRLGWRRLEEAAEAKQREGVAAVKGFGGADVLTEFQKLVEAAQERAAEKAASLREAAAAEARKNPMAAYAPRELCAMGVETIDGVAKHYDLIDEWEPEVLDAVATAILRLSRPGLFETEEARKND